MADRSFAASTARTGRASLLDIDEELGRGLEPEARRAAARQLIVPTGTLRPGSWAPPIEAPNGAELGLLVAEGALTREVSVGRAQAVELLGAGDLIRPWQEEAASFAQSCWRVLQPTGVAILEIRLLPALGHWPTIATALFERAVRRTRWLVVQAAVSHLVGVEKRVLMILWHIAEKWGRVEAEGVVITVPLTHHLLAEMAGAGRAYVTNAIGTLNDGGELSRRSDGLYVLHGEPPELDDAGTAAAGAI